MSYITRYLMEPLHSNEYLASEVFEAIMDKLRRDGNMQRLCNYYSISEYTVIHCFREYWLHHYMTAVEFEDIVATAVKFVGRTKTRKTLSSTLGYIHNVSHTKR